MDLEAAKTATVDYGSGNGKAKSNRFHAGRNGKGRNPKETIIVNQPGNNTTTTTTTTQKKGWSSTAKEPIMAVGCSYRSHYIVRKSTGL
jgi:hypothetical protein